MSRYDIEQFDTVEVGGRQSGLAVGCPLARRGPAPGRRLAITAVAGGLSLAGLWAAVVAAQVDATGIEIAINDGTSNT